MKDYPGYNKNLVSDKAYSNNYRYTNALTEDMIVEPTPYLNRTAISKGAMQLGTISGTQVLAGIITGGTIRSAQIGSTLFVGGTVNNTIIGTPTITGGTGNSMTLGTPFIVGGTGNNLVLGTPSMVGGTISSVNLATPTITAGSFTDKITIGTGANSSVGLGTLTAGIATITTNKITANSFIFVTPVTNGANLGMLSAGSVVAGTSFVVRSSNVLDADIFNWFFIN